MLDSITRDSIILQPDDTIRRRYQLPHAVVAIAPVYAYYAQLALIRKEKSLGSFSIMVCAILLISNILRVFFWLTTGFAVNLLFQSLFIICIQVLLPSPSSCCSRNALSSSTTPNPPPPLTSRISGNGPLSSNTVALPLCSLLSAGTNGLDDGADADFPAAERQHVRRPGWPGVDDDRSDSGLAADVL